MSPWIGRPLTMFFYLKLLSLLMGHFNYGLILLQLPESFCFYVSTCLLQLLFFVVHWDYKI